MICPSCCLVNKTTFNFCTGCGCNLKEKPPKIDDEKQSFLPSQSKEDPRGGDVVDLEKSGKSEADPVDPESVDVVMPNVMEKSKPFIQSPEHENVENVDEQQPGSRGRCCMQRS